MAIILPDGFPRDAYGAAGVSFLAADRALRQDIRPLRLLLVTLMPHFLETETQILRLLANSPLQVEVTMLRNLSVTPPRPGDDQLLDHHLGFDLVRDARFDALVITGAGTTGLPFHHGPSWDELAEFLDWTIGRVGSSLFIGWGAEAALSHYHGVLGQRLPEPRVGLAGARVLLPDHPLLSAADAEVTIPVARSTHYPSGSVGQPAQPARSLDILLASELFGAHLIQHRAGRRLYLLDHLEVSAGMFAREFRRPTAETDARPRIRPPQRWRAFSHLLLANWLNFEVYQPLSLAGELAASGS